MIGALPPVVVYEEVLAVPKVAFTVPRPKIFTTSLTARVKVRLELAPLASVTVIV